MGSEVLLDAVVAAVLQVDFDHAVRSKPVSLGPIRVSVEVPAKSLHGNIGRSSEDVFCDRVTRHSCLISARQPLVRLRVEIYLDPVRPMPGYWIRVTTRDSSGRRRLTFLGVVALVELSVDNSAGRAINLLCRSPFSVENPLKALSYLVADAQVSAVVVVSRLK